VKEIKEGNAGIRCFTSLKTAVEGIVCIGRNEELGGLKRGKQKEVEITVRMAHLPRKDTKQQYATSRQQISRI